MGGSFQVASGASMRPLRAWQRKEALADVLLRFAFRSPFDEQAANTGTVTKEALRSTGVPGAMRMLLILRRLGLD